MRWVQKVDLRSCASLCFHSAPWHQTPNNFSEYKSPAFQLKCHHSGSTKQSACHLSTPEKQHLLKWVMQLIVKCLPWVFLWVEYALFVNLREWTMKKLVIMWFLRYSLAILRPRAALQAAVRLEASVSNSILLQVSVLSSCHFPLTRPSYCLLLPLSKQGAPPHHIAPLQTHRAKLEVNRIRMGNLPVIPRKAAKRAISLINSLLRRLVFTRPPVHPSAVHPWSRREERLKELRGAIKKTEASTRIKKGEEMQLENERFLPTLPHALHFSWGSMMREDVPRQLLLSPLLSLSRGRVNVAYNGEMDWKTSHLSDCADGFVWGREGGWQRKKGRREYPAWPIDPI